MKAELEQVKQAMYKKTNNEGIWSNVPFCAEQFRWLKNLKLNVIAKTALSPLATRHNYPVMVREEFKANLIDIFFSYALRDPCRRPQDILELYQQNIEVRGKHILVNPAALDFEKIIKSVSRERIAQQIIYKNNKMKTYEIVRAERFWFENGLTKDNNFYRLQPRRLFEKQHRDGLNNGGFAARQRGLND